MDDQEREFALMLIGFAIVAVMMMAWWVALKIRGQEIERRRKLDEAMARSWRSRRPQTLAQGMPRTNRLHENKRRLDDDRRQDINYVVMLPSYSSGGSGCAPPSVSYSDTSSSCSSDAGGGGGGE
jgi:hypothetical protein